MLIGEIKPSEMVSLRIQKGDKVGNFDLRVKQLSVTEENFLRQMSNKREEALALEPFRVNGKIVNLEAPGLHYDLTYVVDRQALRWKGVKLYHKQLGNSKSEIIITDHNSIRIERRKGDRLPLALDGNVVAQGRTLRRVFLRDVSLGGIGLLMPRGGSFGKNSEFQLEWEDRTNTTVAGDIKRRLSVPVRVVRVTPLDATRNVVGCRMITYDQREISAYLEERLTTMGRRARL